MKTYKIKYKYQGEIVEKILKLDSVSIKNLPNNILEITEYKSKFNLEFLKQKTIKDKQVNLLFYELNLMLDSNIDLSTALDILIKNKKDKNILEFLKSIKYSLVNSKSIDETLKDFKVNYLVKSFLKISQNSGNLNENIKALSQLLIENHEIKKSFIKAISYPIVLLISFLLSLFSIFNFVIPKFKMIFSQSTNELPFATKLLLDVQFVFENYTLYILISLLSIIFLISYFYKTNDKFKYFNHKLLIENIFLIKDIYLNMQLYRVFLLIDIMLKSNYEFHQALLTSKVLLKNKYLLDKISLIDNLLQNGKSINESFLRTNIFDDIVLNLVNTGEVSNSLPITIKEIKKIYKNRFDEKIKILTQLIPPIFLIIIMALILWIVLAIFMPIWDMGNMIKV